MGPGDEPPVCCSMPTTMPGAMPCSSANALTANSLTKGRRYELRPHRSGNQHVRCPLIGLLLRSGIVAVRLVDENVFLAVEQDMRRFMEEGEPKMVVGLVASIPVPRPNSCGP